MKKFVNVFLLMLMVLPFTSNISFASEQEEKPSQREIIETPNMDDCIALAGEDNILDTADDFYVKKEVYDEYTGVQKGQAILQPDGSVLLQGVNNEVISHAFYKKVKNEYTGDYYLQSFAWAWIGNLYKLDWSSEGKEVSGEATATVTPQGIVTYNISNSVGIENPNNNVFKVNVAEESLSVPGIDGVFGTEDDVSHASDFIQPTIMPFGVLNHTTIGEKFVVGIGVPQGGSIKYYTNQLIKIDWPPNMAGGARAPAVYLLQHGGVLGGVAYEYKELSESLSDDGLGKIRSSASEFANVDDASQLTDEQLIEKFGVSAEYDGQEVPVEVTRTVANSSYSLITFHYNKPNVKTPQGIGSITTTLFNGYNERIIPDTPKPEQPGNGNNGNGTGQNTPNPNPTVENTTTTEQAKPEENKNTVNTGVNSVVSIGLLSVVVIASTLLFFVRKK